jgi:hypothetical protein
MTKASKKRAVKRGRKPGGKVRFHGITADAAALSVCASWLWLVLSGRRKSARLMQRYQSLKSK